LYFEYKQWTGRGKNDVTKDNILQALPELGGGGKINMNGEKKVCTQTWLVKFCGKKSIGRRNL
jgi:hypothetical protein